MTTTAEHVHEVVEYHRVLDLSWCVCGQELTETDRVNRRQGENQRRGCELTE